MASTSLVDVMGEEAAQLYTVYGKLSAAVSNPAQMAAEVGSYQTILASVKGSDQVKQLAADYIPQFLHFFPSLVESGINAQVDLIEDEKPIIRIHAIRGLELICKNIPSTVGRIADVLAQLLIVQEPIELNCVKSTFSALFNIDAKAAFLALFTQAAIGANEVLRKTVLEFIQAQLKSLTPALKKDSDAAAALSAGLKSLLTSGQNAQIGRDELRFFIQSIIAFSPHGNNMSKIKGDEGLKAELGLIAQTQAGLAGGAPLDVSSETALRHFLAVQGIASTLAKDYGVDAEPFVQVFYQQFLPNLDSIAVPELKTQIVQAIANWAPKLTPKQSQTYFSTFFNLFKSTLPTGEVIKPVTPSASGNDAAPAAPVAPAATPAADAKIDYSMAEFVLYLFHVLAPNAPAQLKASTGIFEPTGQPGENIHAPSEKKDEFINRIEYLLQSNAAYKASLHAVQKTIGEQLKEGSKKLSGLKAAAAGKTPKPLSAAATGQPPEAEKPAPEPMAPEVAQAAIEAEIESQKVLRSKQQSVGSAIRISANLVALAKPLLNKPLPAFIAPANLTLSWRPRKAPTGKPQQPQQGGKPAGGKGQSQPQQSKGAKQPQGKGQKRKSTGSEPATKAQSNKKRSAGQQAQGASQSQSQAKKKQKTGGNQQQQQQQNTGNQQRSNKKQKTNPNQGGNRQQSNSNKGARRR